MKTILYYFSGTGNTLMLARMLADELGKNDTEIVNIVSCLNTPPASAQDAERIGILFPVYAFGLPRIMHNFVRDTLQVPENSYVFSITNYADAGGAAALKQLKALLRDRNIALQAGFGLKMPSNYIPFGGAEKLQKQDKKFSNAATRIVEFARIIRQQPREYFYRKSLLPLFAAKFFTAMFMRNLDKEAKKFYVNNNCTSCNLCVNICPTGNIKLVDGRPVWGSNCEQCLACLQWCPVTAIHRKGISENRAHYHNPNLTAKDLIKDMHPDGNRD